MNNLEHFKKAIHWEPIDRILTCDYLDNREILIQYGGFDLSKEYSFEELIEINGKAWQRIGLDVTRSIYDPINHWMGGENHKLDQVLWSRCGGMGGHSGR